MSEEIKREKNQHLVDILTSKGYDTESAVKVVTDVVEAMKQSRLLMLEEYRHKRVVVAVGELHIEAFVHDVKVTEQGASFQIKPVAGDKAMWVKDFIKVI